MPGQWYPGFNAPNEKIEATKVNMAAGFMSQPPTLVSAPGTWAPGAGTVTNTTGYDCMVYASATVGVGTISINGAALAGTVGAGVAISAYLPANQTLSFTYGGVITWKWLAV